MGDRLPVGRGGSSYHLTHSTAPSLENSGSLLLEPSYLIENRYSVIVDPGVAVIASNYEVETTETHFELDVSRRLAVANRKLMDGKPAVALGHFRRLRALIAQAVEPRLGAAGAASFEWSKVPAAAMSEALAARSAEILSARPAVRAALPSAVLATGARLPREVREAVDAVAPAGLTTDGDRLHGLLDGARADMDRGDHQAAAEALGAALEATEDPTLGAALRHDMALLAERGGERDAAVEGLSRAAEALGDSPSVRAEVMGTLAGVLARGGETDRAGGILEEIGVRLPRPVTGFADEGAVFTHPVDLGTIRPRIGTGLPRIAPPRTVEEVAAAPVALLAPQMLATLATARRFAVLGTDGEVHRIDLGADAAGSLKAHLERMRETADLGLLHGWTRAPTHVIAYLTHIALWVVPVAMGDCHAALGDHAAAEREYHSCLDYPYLNEVVEVVTLWIRLAELYLAWGDRLYRLARNDVSRFAAAREKYEQVVLSDDRIEGGSPLYAHDRFAGMRERATRIIAEAFAAEGRTDDNPRIALALASARMQIRKIDARLNFIGVGVHVPPFSFEHMQTVARHFAYHAAQVEQAYVEFQNRGEEGQLRAQQIAQQAELASASVELERRGRNEARAGVEVAEANRDAADQQLANAKDAAAGFDAARGELIELAALQAWSSAAAVDEDDEIKQTTSGYGYYNADSRRRSLVLQDLAAQRARLTNRLEADRLAREVAAAQAYRDLAREQVDQARARIEVAEQRIAIARLQRRQARDNLEFLSSREFSADKWYDMAREARLVAGRYLDAAIEVATLMEKAYEAETGRDLRRIKFEYGAGRTGGHLGATALMLDIDSFTFDIVRTRSKRAPMRVSISLADAFPMAFERLLSTGTAMFETTLEQFERLYPGFCLLKVKAVELRVVGLTGSEGLHGTLRNVGLSKVRRRDGRVEDQIHPADVMPLSEYDARLDAIVFQHDPKDLRLFENNGVATMWRLDLPLGTNTFNLRHILDVQLVMAFDGFHEPGVEAAVRAALPARGEASRGISLRLHAPDELFFLRAHGEGRLVLTPDVVPANHADPRLVAFRLQARGEGVEGLKLRVGFDGLGDAHTFVLDADGRADGAAFATALDRPLDDTLTFTVDPEENPGFDPSGLGDLSMIVEYTFDYRS